MQQTHRFYKDEDGWFIDLPEFIEQGLGTKGNLAMVLGADTLLDRLSEGIWNSVILSIDEEPFEYCSTLSLLSFDQPTELLEEVGHPIETGAYYKEEGTDHVLWLCPVTRFVFGGYYPETIHFKVI